MDDQNQTGQAPVVAAPVVDPAGAGSLQKPSPAAVAELGAASEAKGVADARGAGAEAEAAALHSEKVAAEAAAGADGQSSQSAQAHFEAMRDRARAVVAAYEHGMETNSPRTMAELNELKALFFGE